MQSERLGAVSAPPCVRWDRQLGDVSLWPIRWGLGRLLDWRERQRGNPAFTFLAAPSRKHRGFWKLLLIEGLRRIVFVGYFHRQHDHHLHDQFAVLPCGELHNHQSGEDCSWNFPSPSHLDSLGRFNHPVFGCYIGKQFSPRSEGANGEVIGRGRVVIDPDLTLEPDLIRPVSVVPRSLVRDAGFVKCDGQSESRF